MKKIFNLFSIVLILASCAPTSYYQLYDITPVQKSITKSENLFFEDENCKITYDLWGNGGDIGFQFYNKTDEIIKVNLNESFFILNGFAYDYYKNRTYTSSRRNSASVRNKSAGSVALTGLNIYNNIQTNKVSNSNSSNLSTSLGSAVSFKEDSIISIPAKTTKTISEYSINNSLIRNCEIESYPRKPSETVAFSINKSPIVFSNRITYRSKGKKLTVENGFFVSGITNYPAFNFFMLKQDEYCGTKGFTKSRYFKYDGVNKFYIRYKR